MSILTAVIITKPTFLLTAVIITPSVTIRPKWGETHRDIKKFENDFL